MSITIRMLLVTLAWFAATAAGANAQPMPDRDPGEMMRRADTDGDGTVSRDEFIKARTADLQAAFDRIDANGDGKLDEQEVTAAAERMRSMGAGGREGFRRPDSARPRRPDGDDPSQQGGEWPQRPGSGAGGEEAFNRLDRDGDGKLSREEFAEGVARMREFIQRGGGRPGGLGMPDRGGRGTEEGFRRPPQQD